MIRSTLKKGISRLLGKPGAPPPVTRPAGPPPSWQGANPATIGGAPPPVREVVEAAPPVAAAPAESAAPAVASPENVPPVVDAAPAEASLRAPVSPTDDTAGPALSLEAVQAIMDEMVRPALQGDGGDITLLRVEDNDVYVKLVGSCSTCPSSIMTMKMGVEALLKEEFPQMKNLIQVD